MTELVSFLLTLCKTWKKKKKIVFSPELLVTLSKKMSGNIYKWRTNIQTFDILFIGMDTVLVRMRENTDQNNSEYGHFVRSGYHDSQEA